MGLLSNIVHDNKFTPNDVPKFEAKLFFEGAKRRKDLEQFTVLLFLSTIIATYGVIGDSTATVIGAMIIAPLMAPIISFSYSIDIFDWRLARRSLITVISGVLLVVFVAFLDTLESFLHLASFIVFLLSSENLLCVFTLV